MFSLAVINSKSTSIQVAPESNPLNFGTELTDSSVWAHIEYSLKRVESNYHAQLLKKLPILNGTISRLSTRFGKDCPILVKVSALYREYAMDLQLRLINTKSILHPLCRKILLDKSSLTNNQAGIARVMKSLPMTDMQVLKNFNRVAELSKNFNLAGAGLREFRCWQMEIETLHNEVVLALQGETAHLRRLLLSVGVISSRDEAIIKQSEQEERSEATDNSWSEAICQLDDQRNQQKSVSSSKVEPKSHALIQWLGSRIMDFAVAASCFLICASLPV